MLATVGRDGRPEATRIWAARFREGSDTLELCVHRSGSKKLLGILSAGGRVATNLIEVRSYRSRMFKGPCTISQSAVDPHYLQESLAAMQSEFVAVGLPDGALDQMLSHYDEPRAMAVLLLEVEAVFDQSPKRGAGARL
jgi:hypothetical protein